MTTVTDDPRRILRLRDVLELTGLSRSEIYVRMGNGEFPVTVQLGLRAVGWRARDVYGWLDELSPRQYPERLRMSVDRDEPT